MLHTPTTSTWLRRHWLILTLAALYAAVFSALSILRHLTFQTQTWDLAVFEQSFWHTLHGKFFYNNFENANHLSVHFSPFLVLLVPFYAIFPSPFPLLILQSIALALGVIPLYLLVQDWAGKRAAVMASITYLLFPSLHWINLFDIHEVPYAVPAILWAWWATERQRWVVATVALALAASAAENMILAVAAVGAYLLLFRQGQRGFGAGVLVASLLYFTAVSAIIMPALGGKIYRWDRYAQLGETPSQIVRTVLTQPSTVWATLNQTDKYWYLAKLFAPLAGWPLASPSTLVLLVPGLAQNLLTNFANQYSGHYQYDSLLIPFLFFGVAASWRTIARRWPERLPVLHIVALGASLAGFLWWSPLGLTRFPWSAYRFDDRVQTLAALRDRIPADAAIAVPTNLVPHLTHREKIWMTGAEPAVGAADLVVVDLWETTGFTSSQHFTEYLQGYLDSSRYHVQRLKQRYLVLVRRTAAAEP